MSDKIIITIHGIHTNKKGNDWQDNFKALLAKNNPEVKVFNFKYGYVFGAFSWVMSWIVGAEHLIHWSKGLTAIYVRDFERFVRTVLEENPGAEVSIIAHSLGTWITNEVLGNLEDCQLQNIVLVSAVISSHIENLAYVQWIGHKRIKSVFAWCSHNDMVVKLIAQFPFGHLGYWGFLRETEAADRERPLPQPYPDLPVFNRMTSEPHSGVLDMLEIYGDQLISQLLS